jgi:decaprenylphospho-beta-D-ribofuranose 2-oxidase
MTSHPTDDLPEFMRWEDLSSLVGRLRTRSLVARPTTVEQCRQTLAFCRDRGMTICVRGAGRGYGDLALNDGHAILDMSGMNRIVRFDEQLEQITVEPGVRLVDIFREVHHKLLTLPASPTESHSSVAGAISANVNGKDGWRHGNFSHQVVAFDLMLADGSVTTVTRDHALFNAVVGGIGLLGIVLGVTLQLKRIPSNYVHIDRIPAADVDALLETMRRVETDYDAAVVWVDAYAGGNATGRSVIHAAKWVDRDASENERERALAAGFQRLEDHRRFGLALHERLGPVLSLMLYAQRPLVTVFNRLYYTMGRVLHRLGRASNSELFLRFNFEASFTVPPAHLVCGPRGYTVQLNFPKEDARAAMIELLGICRSSPSPPVTTILRSHRSDDGMLSFSEDGYSLNFEFHPKKRNEAASRAAVDRLIEATIRRGGKIHLAKDQVLRPDQFYAVYPRYSDLLEVKARLDPEGLFSSDLARRVGLHQGVKRGVAMPDDGGVAHPDG